MRRGILPQTDTYEPIDKVDACNPCRKVNDGESRKKQKQNKTHNLKNKQTNKQTNPARARGRQV
jgi:hypothetical protein